MKNNEATIRQRLAFLESAAGKLCLEADQAEAQLLLTPADEHLHGRLIALRKKSDDAQAEIECLRSELAGK
jgi:hypothetical protein